MTCGHHLGWPAQIQRRGYPKLVPIYIVLDKISDNGSSEIVNKVHPTPDTRHVDRSIAIDMTLDTVDSTGNYHHHGPITIGMAFGPQL